MKAEVKGYHSPDVIDLDNHIPDKHDEFCFLLQVFVGPKNKIGEESFDLLVCTPKWFLRNYNCSDMIFGYHHLIVFEYNFEMIKEKLELYVNNIFASNWDDIVKKMSLIGKWEFEGYNESTNF